MVPPIAAPVLVLGTAWPDTVSTVLTVKLYSAQGVVVASTFDGKVRIFDLRAVRAAVDTVQRWVQNGPAASTSVRVW